uniref:SAFB-like transcription modulator n=1 Tax=Schistocephalus solidus TaxID=70667 RepID=A0A0X3PVM0_SCHSO
MGAITFVGRHQSSPNLPPTLTRLDLLHDENRLVILRSFGTRYLLTILHGYTQTIMSVQTVGVGLLKETQPPPSRTMNLRLETVIRATPVVKPKDHCMTLTSTLMLLSPVTGVDQKSVVFGGFPIRATSVAAIEIMVSVHVLGHLSLQSAVIRRADVIQARLRGTAVSTQAPIIYPR